VASQQEPGERPNRTRLTQPPGARYGEPATPGTPASAPTAAGLARGIAWATAVAIGGAAVIVALGGPFAASVGLVIVAVLIGRFVALALRAGAGAAMTPRARRATAVVLAVIAVLLGQLGIWLYARSEGGVLGLVDYLGQTFGWLVPAQLIAAGAVAWWSSR
jgi:hypothetical protein